MAAKHLRVFVLRQNRIANSVHACSSINVLRLSLFGATEQRADIQLVRSPFFAVLSSSLLSCLSSCSIGQHAQQRQRRETNRGTSVMADAGSCPALSRDAGGYLFRSSSAGTNYFHTAEKIAGNEISR